MEEIIINGKALYTPKGAAREYAAVGCNFYTGCPHNCSYCYLKRGVLSKQLGGTEVRLKKCFNDETHAKEVLVKELDANLDYLKKVGIFLSFTTDPLIKETRSMTSIAITEALIRDIPVMLLTKDATFIFDECDFMAWMDAINIIHRDKVAFGFTLTGCDDMEPGASTNEERIEAMKLMSIKGFKTWASIEPIIDFNSSLFVIEKSIRWCDHYKIGLRSGVGKDYYDLDELTEFVCDVNHEIEVAKRDYARSPTVYWKESVKKVCKIPHVYPGYWDSVVGKDYIW